MIGSPIICCVERKKKRQSEPEGKGGGGWQGNTNGNFGVTHSSLHDVLIRLSVSLRKLRLLALPDLVLDLLRVRAGFVVHGSYLCGFDGLGVIAHREENMRLPDVRLDWRMPIVSSSDANNWRIRGGTH
jgi:hypothetical protein